jgi:hypothetical protein
MAAIACRIPSRTRFLRRCRPCARAPASSKGKQSLATTTACAACVRRKRKIGDSRDVWRQIIIASNPTTAIPTAKKANAAASCSSQCLCTRMKIILHLGMGEHQLSMDN